MTPPDGGPEVFGPATSPELNRGPRRSSAGKDRSTAVVARQTVPFNKNGIGSLPDDKPVVYIIATDSGRVIYTGVAKRGRVQERLQEHLPQGPAAVPCSKVSIEQVETIAAARAKERTIIAESQPKYNINHK